jgi:ATP-dependent RNA helicase DDX31/DBP7
VGRRLRRQDGLVALVLVPTRELAVQTHKALAHAMHGARGAVGGVVLGGESKDAEKRRLRKGGCVNNV